VANKSRRNISELGHHSSDTQEPKGTLTICHCYYKPAKLIRTQVICYEAEKCTEFKITNIEKQKYEVFDLRITVYVRRYCVRRAENRQDLHKDLMRDEILEPIISS
jgi:hypothetical protein